MVGSIQFEQVACRLCGEDDGVGSDVIMWRGEELRYVICRVCGLKYMTPRPTGEWYRAFYEAEFWQEKVVNAEYHVSGKMPKQAVAEDEGLRRRLEKQRWRAERVVGILSQVADLGPDSKVLDIGTAFGVTLDAIRERWGCQIFGVEPSSLGRDYASTELGIELAGRYMEDMANPQEFDGQLDLVIMSHVLENTVDPLEGIESARRLLSGGGQLYLDTPNFYYYNAVNPYHPYVFGPETLEALLAKGGLRVVEWRMEPLPTEGCEPEDPFLTVVATPDPAVRFERTSLDVEQLVAAQALGVARFKATRKAKKKGR